MKFIIWVHKVMLLSFEQPEYANSDALGALRILEAIRILKLEKKQNIIKHQLLKFMEQ